MDLLALLARHPVTLATFTTTRLAWLPRAWVSILDQALSRIEALLSPEELRELVLDDIREKYATLRIEAWHQGRQEEIDRICVAAEDASEAAINQAPPA